MDISSVNSDLIRGNVTTIILGCLLKDDKYGYEILKEIEDRSHSQYVLKQATLYNQLKRLEKQGLVSSYDGDPDDTGGGKRRYYSLTKEGRAYLQKEKSEYEYSRTILDKLVSEKEYDFQNPIPFDASELRPYTKREPVETKIVYKDKIVEVEKTVYLDRYGNPIDVQDADSLRAQAELEDENARRTQEELRITGQKLTQTEEEARLREQELQDAVKLREEELSRTQETAKQREEELARTQETAKQREEELARTQETARQREEELARTQETAKQREEELARTQETAKQREEELARTQEQLRKSEEDREFVKGLLRTMEEEKLRAEEERRRLEEERQRQEEEERQRIAEEEERKRQKQQKPSQTLEEMFAKLDAESEYKNAPVQQQEFVNVQPEEHVYINGYTNQPEPAYRSQTTLKDIFKRLDEKEAQIDDRISREQAEQQAEQQAQQQVVEDNRNDVWAQSELQTDNRTYVDPSANDSFATSAVVNRAENGFDYEKDDVNYREFFYSIAADQAPDEKKQDSKQFEYVEGDIKTRLYAKGFKIRPYDRGNTTEYYTFNFLQSNRINRDTFLIVLAFFAVEIAIMWASLATRVSYAYFLPILLIGGALCLVPTVLYLLNPTRRKRANFNFKLSILNRTMLFIELSVVCVLIGFFALGASVNDLDLILCSIVLPIVLLTNLPLSSLIYWLLYRTRRYHIA